MSFPFAPLEGYFGADPSLLTVGLSDAQANMGKRFIEVGVICYNILIFNEL